MLFHICVILFLCILAAFLFSNGENKHTKKAYLSIVFFTLFFISAFRSINIGNDTATYVNFFELFGTMKSGLSFDTNSYFESRIEIGYILFNKILYLISKDYLILLSTVSAFVIGVWVLHIYKYSSMTWLSVYLFINLRLFYFSLSGLRQSIAMAIVLLSYKFLKDRKVIHFCLIILIASMFHLSALIFILIYPLSRINFSYRFIGISVFIGCVLFVTFDKVLIYFLRVIPKYNMYLNSVYFDGNIKVASIVNFIIIFIIFIFGAMVTKRKSSSIPSLNSELNILNHIVLLGAIISFLSINASIVNRFTMYFFMFIVIYIPMVLRYMGNEKLKLIILYAILVFTLAYNIVILYYRPEWQNVYPYEFIWQSR